jgi:hypothetical protein
MEQVVDVLKDIKVLLEKIERNQRFHTKVVLGTRVLTLPYSQAKDLTPEQLAELGVK